MSRFNIALLATCSGILAATTISVTVWASEICLPSMAAGTTCSCALASLHPTQFAVGKLYVEELEAKGLDKLSSHVAKEPAKIIFGPTGTMYIVDGHHHASAMYSIQPTDTSICQVAAVIPSLPTSEAPFWKAMEGAGFARLQDADGVEHAGVFPPLSLSNLADDPFRSVASWLEKSCRVRLSGDFAEFRLADLLRHDPNAVTPHGENDKDAAVTEAMKFVHDPTNQTALGGIPGADGLETCP